MEVVSSLPSYVCGERKEVPHARARSPRHASPRLAGPGRAMGAGARRAREWSAEIRPLALRGRGFLLPFQFLFGYLAFKSARYFWNPKRFRSRSRREIVGFPIYATYRPLPETHLFELGFLPLLAAAPPP